MAGIGGLVALVVAYRRQKVTEAADRHQRDVAADTKHDLAERRITELYTKAVEQLGHEKAAVRLGGLYALERLAQNNPAHRQTRHRRALSGSSAGRARMTGWRTTTFQSVRTSGIRAAWTATSRSSPR